jgi:hypothetical protein
LDFVLGHQLPGFIIALLIEWIARVNAERTGRAVEARAPTVRKAAVLRVVSLKVIAIKLSELSQLLDHASRFNARR